MNREKIKIVLTDFDGTLLHPKRYVTKKDFETLKILGNLNICRVIVTGRSMFSLKRILKDDFPIDYIIFSSGAGIMDWESRKIIYSKNLDCNNVTYVSDVFICNNVDFSIQYPIPDNHKFVFYKAKKHNPDFNRRCELYKNYAFPLDIEPRDFGEACQIVAIFPYNLTKFNHIRNSLKNVNIIRTTSPLDGNSIWMEVLPNDVSKGYSSKWLCQYLGIQTRLSLGIGNDYNDIDLLDWTNYSYVVSNAPDELKRKYKLTYSNSNNGFTKAIYELLTI